jgi:hypothetical protein
MASEAPPSDDPAFHAMQRVASVRRRSWVDADVKCVKPGCARGAGGAHGARREHIAEQQRVRSRARSHISRHAPLLAANESSQIVARSRTHTHTGMRRRTCGVAAYGASALRVCTRA